eukprot:CAMPEP_0184978404 /NCGR_PEP_ID=MMETSP1098-20130426/8896_1 /TAXON_ID=89044 /ORGANISM="Spumella elongata, Strain CCAP 955/1" /LENGTH=175 /DNA_ID=CAMNT_0027501527 /DNA_START=293 /DNA_END=820 /DNA_ORIENTATION=-
MEESTVIRDMFPKHGTKWSQYISALPGRSDNAIKNRYHLISRNNFEYCKQIHVIVALKRPQSELSTEDLGSDTVEEKSDDKRKRLDILIAARLELDREIEQLEQSCFSVQPPPQASQPTHQDIFTTFKVEAPYDEEHSDFNLDFDWTDPDTPMASAPSNVAYDHYNQMETSNEEV